MIKSVTVDELAEALKKENSSWDVVAVERLATEYINYWDVRLSEVLEKYVREGRKVDYVYGEFTVNMIQALRHNCGYLYAISLMDGYMKDEKNGRAAILRRG